MVSFEKDISDLNESKRKASETLLKISISRIFVFLVIIILTFWNIRNQNETLIWLFASILIPVFFWLISLYKKAQTRKNFIDECILINHEEVCRLQENWDSIEGYDFVDPKHPFAEDLDLFRGRKNIFKLISRLRSTWGRDKIKEWLVQPADQLQIKPRQEAVMALSQNSKHCQEFIAWPGVFGKKKRLILDPELWTSTFILWHNKRLTLLLKILPFISFAVWILYLTDTLSLGYALLMVAINIGLTGSKHKALHSKLERTELLGTSLKVLLKQLELIKTSEFKATELSRIRERLTEQGHNAYVEIKKLTTIVNWLETHHNHVFAGILNALILWDWIWLFAFEKWQNRNMSHIQHWIDDMANWEAFCSIALFKNANSDYTFPSISDKDFVIQGTEIAHPLIDKKNRVANDFFMSEEGSTALITGSNMAGKSTFLRTLALNTCLAYIGAPVCAKTFEVSYLSVFTAMRSNDSLEDEISSFKAELLRLRLLLDQVEKGQKTFYFLDEILKGTNSEDRHKGAEGLIKKLSLLPSFGLISTHDLELTSLDKDDQLKVHNFAFESELQNGQLTFDYKLNFGTCRRANASALMKSMKIID